jgi:hypothetical protein
MKYRLAMLLVFGIVAVSKVSVANSIPITVNCVNGVQQGFNMVAVVGCLVPGGGSYTGDVKAIGGDTFLKLILTNGTFTGTSSGTGGPLASSPYFFMGEGVLRSFLNGSLIGVGGSAGGESFDISADATSFSNRPAPTFWKGPMAGTRLPVPVTGFGRTMVIIRDRAHYSSLSVTTFLRANQLCSRAAATD